MLFSPSSRTIWSAALLLTTPAMALTNPLLARQADTAFDWTTITPTPDLQYHPCYDIFQCARLQVPLDWSKPNTSLSGPHAAIAIVTLPATVPVTDPAYAGTILLNPGGPGGQGTGMALTMGQQLQSIVDVPGERHYDLLGFDPRGVGLTTPSSSCYATQFDRAAAGIASRALPSILTAQGLQMVFETNRGVGQLCEQTAGKDGIFRHMSTASVARDMLEIVDRSHELVRKAAGNGTAKACGGGSEKPGLQYLGVSYGSILGNTFASMFPDRVGRMVVDGIADAEDYMTGAWAKQITEAEDSINVFYSTCFDAGDACVLRQTTDTSAANIRARVTALILSLQQAPVSAVYDGRVYLVTSFILSETIRQALYAPITAYEPLSVALSQALEGNYTLILSNANVLGPDAAPEVCTEPPATSPPQVYTHAREATIGIACSDSQASAPNRDTLAWAATAVSTISNQSVTIGEAWANNPLICADWPFAPPYAFAGPFGSPAPAANNTSRAPLLILSTRLDHATPLANAFALSRLHGGSAVVVQESVGHCAILSSVSPCVNAILKEYFRSGTVPANGTVCADQQCKPEIPYKACPGLLGA